MRTRYLPIVFALGLGLALVLLWQPVPGGAEAVSSRPAPVSAAPAAELHVCPSGCAYLSVQAAVDAANEGDVIKVAEGTYTDISVRPRDDVTTTGVVTQVVYVSKTVTIQGGYTTTNWTTSDPEANPTTLDAHGQGRVLYITGDISATVEGLRITGGDAAGLGGWLGPFAPPGGWDEDAGGGVYVISATASITDNHIFGNTSVHVGGGVALIESEATLSDNIVSANTAGGGGGGVFLQSGNGTLSGNTISGNTARAAGGLELWASRAMVGGNTVTGNTASEYGCGGVRLFISAATLRGNTITANTAVGNKGGGLCIMACDGAALVSNLIADNEAGTVGSGMHVEWSSPRLSHNTIARNSGGDGSGIYIREFDPGDTACVTITNTILVSQSVGIEVTGGNTATVNGILWYNTPITISQSPTATVSVQNQLTGAPAFVDPDNGDYHIGAGSPARDVGVDSGVSVDIDGQWRPMGLGYDLGADEYPGAGLDVAKQASLALVNRGETLTYTIAVTSAGTDNATGIVLTDTLDGWQRPIAASSSLGGCTIPDAGWGGSAVCTPGTVVTGTTVVVTLTAQVSTAVTVGQAVVNTVLVTANETVGGSAQATTYVQDCHARINAGSTKYPTVQAAVDAAGPDDLVKVAGTCIGTDIRAGLRQQVYLDKSIIIRGGYTTTDWTTPDPDANPTTLDALGEGRVFYVTGDITTTIEGLRFTGGDAAGLGGTWCDAGGGMYIISATTTLVNNQIFSNTAYAAAGLWMWHNHATLTDNAIYGNTADWCGGLNLAENSATLSGNTVNANVSRVWSGGGLCLNYSDATLSGDTIVGNTAGSSSGGLTMWESDVTLTNVVVADNQAASVGSGLRILDSSARLVHTTIARNSGGDGSGVHVGGSGPYSTVALTNTILADHSVGISVTGGNTVTINGILWHNTPVTVSQSAGASVSLENEHTGDAGFEPDGYHLLPYSAAIDQGVDAGVTVDIDGEARPVGAGYDLGADEDGVVADLTLVKSDDPDPGVVGQPLTYTLAVANRGPVGATGVVVTETLPGGTTFVSASAGCDRVGGNVVCLLGDLAPDEQRTVSVHLTPNSTGQLIDLAVAGANEPDPNPANDADCELTAIAAAPVLDPALTGISPDYGRNDGPTAVSIEGQRFQDGATASLDGTALEGVTFVDAEHLQATVPAGLTPGAYDLTVTNPDARSATLPGAFTVLLPGGPTVTSIEPAQGPVDLPVTVDIRGLNFSSGVSATLSMAGSHVELPALVFVNSSRLFGTVPVSMPLGVYSLTVIGPGGLAGTLPEAYEALAPEINDDLYALETDLWLDPPTVRQGETPRIGLTLRRQGGQGDLADVEVRFHLAGGTPAFTGTAPVLAPGGHVTVTVDWTPSPQPGEHTLYAVIDPLEAVEENNEGNNVVSRTVTVLPPLPDTTPPVVESVTIENGALFTDKEWVSLEVEASDNPGGSGVARVLWQWYLWDRSCNCWHLWWDYTPWVPYEDVNRKPVRIPTHWGAEYVQVWAADAAGNISIEPAGQIINWDRPPTPVYNRQVRVYRVPMEVGQRLQLHIATLRVYGAECGVHVGVWTPAGDRLWWAKVPLAGERGFTFDALQDGVYQIEVESAGSYGAYYELSLVPLDGTQAQIQRFLDDGEDWRTEPIVPPWDTPSRYVGIPSAPLLRHYIYLPLVLRNSPL